jgi:hypothetical protein
VRTAAAGARVADEVPANVGERWLVGIHCAVSDAHTHTYGNSLFGLCRTPNADVMCKSSLCVVGLARLAHTTPCWRHELCCKKVVALIVGDMCTYGTYFLSSCVYALLSALANERDRAQLMHSQATPRLTQLVWALRVCACATTVPGLCTQQRVRVADVCHSALHRCRQRCRCMRC